MPLEPLPALNPLRQRLATRSWFKGLSLMPPATLGMAFVALLFVRGYTRAAGVLLAVEAVLLLVAVSRQERSGPFDAFLVSIADAVGDAIPLAALAWPLRNSGSLGVAGVCAIGCVFVGAYSMVKARSLGYQVPLPPFGAPERAAVLASGLILDQRILLELCLWAIAAASLASALITGVTVWKHVE